MKPDNAADVASLWLLRHGQSEGNVIRDAAHADARAEELDIPLRDMDVGLSNLGARQAQAFGHWLREVPANHQPSVVVASPYRRAIDTAASIVDASGIAAEIHADERLRERDLGAMDMLTLRGFRSRYPAEAARRDRLGKFYYRPPGGESWADVALRCRSARDSIAREYAGARVILVTHEVVIIVFRYLLERLDEHQALALSRSQAIGNCSLTTYEQHDGQLHPEVVQWTLPLQKGDTPVTEEADVRIASR
ncbi:MAG: hypothetical protein QOE83_955 [Actinomycetota bacterium]|nr:hypothetical protein [Actinomycetota bacterium]